MTFPVSRVAVIGAGVSGVLAAKYLKEEGIEVVVFERSRKAGGNWVYDERVETEGEWPCVLPLPEKTTKENEKLNGHTKGPTNIKDNEPYEVNYLPGGRSNELTHDSNDEKYEANGFPHGHTNGDAIEHVSGKSNGKSGLISSQVNNKLNGYHNARGEEINILSQSDKEEHKDFEALALRFAPPGPAYDGLKNNVSFKMQVLKGHLWPERIEEYENAKVSEEYIQSYSHKFKIEELIRYNTSVDRVEKVGEKWRIETSVLEKEGIRKGELEGFDAVVVANGHYHTVKVPDVPGLREWKKAWPERLQHSKTYRRPDGFKDQNVLLIGGGVSAMDIGREISTVAKNVYQSTRGGTFDIPVEMLSPTVQRVPEVTSFDLPSPHQAKPGNITLKDGRILADIDRLILCTGYHHTLPFLPQYHNNFLSPHEANEAVLVTDGTQIHNLHLDIFYIPDPTISFIGLPYYTPTFSFFEYQAIAIAAVFFGKAWLPGEEEMRRVYGEKVNKRGVGRTFHSLRDEDHGYVDEVVAWVNGCGEVTGGIIGWRVEAYGEAYWEGKREREERLRALGVNTGRN